VIIGAPAGGKTTLGAGVADRVVNGGFLPVATGRIKEKSWRSSPSAAVPIPKEQSP
jgi:adenylate kinase family enzyme